MLASISALLFVPDAAATSYKQTYKIRFAHGLPPEHRMAVEITEFAELLNSYSDGRLTGLPPGNLLNYFPELDKNGNKVIFGTDWSALPVDIRENINIIKSLPLSDLTIEAILYNNAHKIRFE